MQSCPFHWVRKLIGDGSRIFSRELMQSPKDTHTKLALWAYGELGDIISEIFPESFFEKEIDDRKFFWVYPLYAKSIFQKLWEEQIRAFFQKERTRWIIYPKREGMKLYPTNIEETVTQWWWHACYMIAVFINEILRKRRNEEKYEESLKEAQKILILLWRQHLNIETWFVLNIDRILGGRCYLDTVYDSIDKIGAINLPALWCPALFFGDKRVGISLFRWISQIMIRVYKNKSSTQLLWESVLLGFQRVLSKIN